MAMRLGLLRSCVSIVVRCVQAGSRRRRQIAENTRAIWIYDRCQTRKREMETTYQKSTGEYMPPLHPSNLPVPRRAYTHLSTDMSQMEDNMMRHRAILTGTFQRASHFNKPLPRMRVQPLHVSVMIQKRIRARERRQEKHWVLLGWAKDVDAEALFESTLEKDAAGFGQTFESVFRHTDWREYIFLPPWTL